MTVVNLQRSPAFTSPCRQTVALASDLLPQRFDFFFATVGSKWQMAQIRERGPYPLADLDRGVHIR